MGSREYGFRVQRQVQIEIGGGAGAGPGWARDFLARTLREWGFHRAIETATLLVSELVTNAVLHGAPPVRLSVETTGSLIRVAVEDGAVALPVQRDPDALSANGRGLLLVDVLASSWGCDDGAGDGKSVWFEVPAHGEEADALGAWQEDST